MQKIQLFFIKNLQKRLVEAGVIDFSNKLPDSTQLKSAIQKYQKQKGIKADGKLSGAIIKHNEYQRCGKI
jgi:hypothetical protein